MTKPSWERRTRRRNKKITSKGIDWSKLEERAEKQMAQAKFQRENNIPTNETVKHNTLSESKSRKQKWAQEIYEINRVKRVNKQKILLDQINNERDPTKRKILNKRLNKLLNKEKKN